MSFLPPEIWYIIFKYRRQSILKDYNEWCLLQKCKRWLKVHQELQKCVQLAELPSEIPISKNVLSTGGGWGRKSHDAIQHTWKLQWYIFPYTPSRKYLMWGYDNESRWFCRNKYNYLIYCELYK